MSEQNNVNSSTSSPTTQVGGYGYATDEVKTNPFNFGLNAGSTTLTKFEWIPNGGKDGAEGEALDIVFKINGTDKSYRMFPVTKAFLANNAGETTDPNSQEMKDAMIDFNSRVVHILHAFMDGEVVKAGLARPMSGFKEYCQICMSLLPKNYKEITLDIFLNFGWNLADKERTYLEIPSKMKYGKWLSATVPHSGNWKELRVENPADNEREALKYVDDAGNLHPFFRNGWFMNSNFAKQQKKDGVSDAPAASNASVAQAAAAPQNQSSGQASAW